MVFTSILLISGEVQTVIACWIMIVCLLPPLILSWRTAYLSIKLFCGIVFVTQLVSLPVFFMNPSLYVFQRHCPFDFTAVEVLPIYLRLSLFLLMMVFLTKGVERVLGPPVKLLDTQVILSKPSRINPLMIVMLVIMLIPWHFWMFKMGIGMTGISPPELPYRLSGILTYLQGYITPIMIGLLYVKTKRKSIFLVVVLIIYALLLGISSVSKGISLLVLAPVIATAWFDKQRFLFLLSSVSAGLIVMLIVAFRAIVYASIGLTSTADTSLGAIGTLLETFTRIEFSSINFFIFSNIANRIEGLQGLIMSWQFNAEAVGGAWGLFYKAIDNHLIDLGHDAMHIEYLGYTIPIYFYNIASSLIDYFLMAANRNLAMILPFVMFTVFMLVTLEKNIFRVAQKYHIKLLLVQGALVFFTLLFYTGPGTVIFNSIFMMLIILRLMPTMRLFRKNKYQSIADLKYIQ